MFYIIIDDDGSKYLYDFESLSYQKTKEEVSIILKRNIDRNKFFAKIVRLDSTAVLHSEVLYTEAE